MPRKPPRLPVSPAKRVWFLVPPRTGLLNVAGPWEVLGHTNDVLGRVAYHLEMLGSARDVQTRHGLVLAVEVNSPLGNSEPRARCR